MVLVPSASADNSHPLASSSASGSASASASGAIQTRSATLDRPAMEKPIRSRSPLTKQARTSEVQPLDSPITIDESQIEDSNTSHFPVPATQELPSQGSLGTFPAAQPDSTPPFGGLPPPHRRPAGDLATLCRHHQQLLMSQILIRWLQRL